jgi:hypothetical protein
MSNIVFLSSGAFAAMGSILSVKDVIYHGYKYPYPKPCYAENAKTCAIASGLLFSIPFTLAFAPILFKTG